MKYLKFAVLYAAFVLCIYFSMRIATVSSETTTLPSWSTGSGYSECDEDVRLVVSPTPLQAKEIRLLITDGYEFMTVFQYEGSFYWYFVRYESCWSNHFRYEDDWLTLPNTDNGDIGLIPERRGW